MSAAIHEHELGISWVTADPLERTAHALAGGGRVWLVDPTDEAAALERAAALGQPVAVLQLLDRHGRACAPVAERLGVPLLSVPDSVPDSPFEALPVVRTGGWRETALWWPEHRALVVAEVVGTATHYAVGESEVGMHPMLRLRPPGLLRSYEPEHLLVGHGQPVHGAAAAAGLREAYASSRRDLPRMVAAAPGLARAALQRWGRSQ